MAKKTFFKVGFCVDDVEKEAVWFEKVLGIGMRERLSTPDGDYIWLDAGNGYVIELLPHNQMPDCPVGFHHIALKTEDAKTALEEVKANGAVARGDAFEAGFGITAADIDGPEGTLFRLLQREGI